MSSYNLGLIVLGPVWLVVNLIFSSKMAEHRTDDIAEEGGMGRTPTNVADRLNPNNYDSMGQRLFPWFVASGFGQLLAFFGWLWFA